MTFKYDAFLCHASEDKDAAAVPLSNALVELGRHIWLDQMTLRIGDSLRRKIDEGLSESRYGIVILSHAFFSKEWTQYELDGLVAREMADSVKVILPVWYGVSAADVRRYSFPLSVRLGGNFAAGLTQLAQDLNDILVSADQRIQIPEILDELSLAKHSILTEALADDEGMIFIQPATFGSSKAVTFGKWAYNDSEKQRKLFLFALDQLVDSGLVERLSESHFELTYLGIQAAERMNRLPIDQVRNLGMNQRTD